MKYFTIEELCRSTRASELHLANCPDARQREHLVQLIEEVLDPAREELGGPITVTSGFRCQALNNAVGGAATSQHLHGAAADLQCSDNARLFEILKRQGRFTQLIWEFGTDRQPEWVHVSGPAWQGNPTPYPKHDILKSVRRRGKTEYIRLQP